MVAAHWSTALKQILFSLCKILSINGIGSYAAGSWSCTSECSEHFNLQHPFTILGTLPFRSIDSRSMDQSPLGGVAAFPIPQLFSQTPILIDRDLAWCTAIDSGWVGAKNICPTRGFFIRTVVLGAAPCHDMISRRKQSSNGRNIFIGNGNIET